MNRMLTVKNNELNEFLKCPLCKGYLIDAFSINECLHSFCKSCIIKYIKRKECCPTCKVSINKERMRLFLRRDVNLQYIVYKLVPNLFKKEMHRRRTFYDKHPKAIKFLKKRKILDNETLGKLDDENVFVFETPADISLSIEYSEQGLSEVCESMRAKEMDPPNPRTYLLCPATMTIEILKKFLGIKHQSTLTSQMDIMYDDTPLRKELTLLDVGFIYAWRRSHPMRLFYRIRELEKEPETQQLAADSAQTEKVPDQPITSTVPQPKESFEEKTEAVIDESKQETIETISKSAENTKATVNEVSTNLEPVNSISDNPSAKKELQSTENANEMSMDTSQNNTTAHLNQTLNNETLTITAMVASIESASRQVLEPKPNEAVITNQKDSTESKRLSKKLDTVTADIEMDVPTNRSEIESHSDKENNAVNDSVVSVSEKSKIAGTESSGKVLDVSCQMLNVASNETAMNTGLMPVDVAVNQPTEPNNSAVNNNKLNVTLEAGSICKAKSKKNPRRITMDAPGTAGGVAKKKKDALTPKDTNDNTKGSDDSKVVQQAKKPRVQKPKQSSAKQNTDYKSIKIKPEPTTYSQDQNHHQQHQQQFPQVKLEPVSYNPAQQQQQQSFQHQINKQFSLPSAQSLFHTQNMFNNTTNYNNTSDNSQTSNPVFKNLQQNLAVAAGGNNLANSFQMTSMSLMNHFLNNQKQQQQQQQQQHWNQFNGSSAVSNALQMSQKFNPQLFEYLQKAQSLQQQQQSSQNFFNPNLQNQNQFFKNQYPPQEDYKPFPNGVPTYQNQYYNGGASANQFQQYTSAGSTCSSEGSTTGSTEPLKEKGFSSLISESCNLVNELN